MKTRTADFDTAWANRRVRKALYYATVKRRYWNGSAFVLESTPLTISRREIDNISGLSSKFDIPLKNRILPSQVSITLLDKKYKWLPSNTANGKWRRDATATIGYDPVGSEFQIFYGLQIADGSIEYLTLFTGIVQDDPSFDSKSGTATFSLLEKASAKLEAGRAQNVGTFIDNGATFPAAGNGVNDTFSTQRMSLWRVRDGTGGTQAVRVAGVDKAQGTDYEVQDLNDAEVEAKIVFNPGFIPTAGQAVLFDGDQWYRDRSISELVGLLCDEAGITSGERIIEEPVFTGVDQSLEYGSAAEWVAGSPSNADVTSLPGFLRRKWHRVDDFTDGDLTANQAWTATNLTASVVAGKMKITGTGPAPHGYIQMALAKRVGTWEWKSAVVASGSADILFAFCDGYALFYREITSTAQLVHAGTLTAVAGSSPFALSGTAEKTYRVTKTEAGVMTITIDGVLKDTTAADTETTTATLFYIDILAASAVTDISFDDFYFSDEIDASTAVSLADMIFESAEINLLAAPSNWLPLDFSVVLNGGTFSVRTKGAIISGGPYEAYVATDAGLTPQSSLRQFLKVEITATDGDFLISPTFDFFTVNWRGSSLFIKSADFTALTCLGAIQELAKIGGMEFGSNGDGTFFFRNQNVVGAADMVLSQKNAILALTKYSTGYRDVRPIATVRYGKSGTDGYYYAEYGAAQSGEASPTTAERFGDKTIDLDLNRFIFANDADVATAVARKLYELNYRPKRKIAIRTRIIAQLDTSDKLKISFHDSPLIEKAIFGDPLQRFPVTGANARTLARDILMKVVGHSPDIIKSESVIDLEEVLS